MIWNDWNWRHWSLIAVIAVGGSFELLKRMPKGDNAWSKEIPRASNQVSESYSVRKKLKAQQPPMMAPAMVKRTVVQNVKPGVQLPALSKEQLAKFNTAAKATEFEHGKKEAEAKGKKKKDDDEWEIVVDPKTGKRIKRRKKKAIAKKEEVKKEEVAKQEEPEQEEDHDTNDEEINNAIAHAMTNGQAPASNSQKADEAFMGADEWMRLLLNRPDKTETLRFIEHYNKALVSQEVFYKVVNAMLADSRPQMKQLGVLCLGSTQPSVLNFQLLAQVAKTERTDSPARRDADGFLNQYASPTRLNILERILRASTGNFTTILATQKLETAAQNEFSRTQTPSAPNPNNGIAAQSAAVKKFSASFSRFDPILTTLTRSTDVGIKDQATRTLNALRNMLNSTGTPVAPAPAVNADHSQPPPTI